MAQDNNGLWPVEVHLTGRGRGPAGAVLQLQGAAVGCGARGLLPFSTTSTNSNEQGKSVRIDL